MSSTEKASEERSFKSHQVILSLDFWWLWESIQWAYSLVHTLQVSSLFVDLTTFCITRASVGLALGPLAVTRWRWCPVSRSGSSVADTDPRGKAGAVSPQDSSGFCPYTHLQKHKQNNAYSKYTFTNHAFQKHNPHSHWQTNTTFQYIKIQTNNQKRGVIYTNEFVNNNF